MNMSSFFLDFGIDSYGGMYDEKYSIGAKLAYDLGYRNSKNLTDEFLDDVRYILNNKNISKADIRERMKWHEFNGLFNMWHHVVENGVVRQMPFFSPLEVAGWYDDRYVIPAIVMKDRWFDEGYLAFQNKTKIGAIRYLKKHKISNDKHNYQKAIKQVYDFQLQRRIREEKIGSVEKHLEFVLMNGYKTSSGI